MNEFERSMIEVFVVQAQLVSGALALNRRRQHQRLYLTDSYSSNRLSKEKASGGFWKTCLGLKRGWIEIIL